MSYILRVDMLYSEIVQNVHDNPHLRHKHCLCPAHVFNKTVLFQAKLLRIWLNMYSVKQHTIEAFPSGAWNRRMYMFRAVISLTDSFGWRQFSSHWTKIYWFLYPSEAFFTARSNFPLCPINMSKKPDLFPIFFLILLSIFFLFLSIEE